MIKIVFVALIGSFCTVALKKINSSFAFASAVITGVIIISMLYIDIDNLVGIIHTFSNSYGINNEHIRLLLKVIGISYITQIASSIAEDCGEKYISQKIEIAGRIFILSLCVPILINLLNTILNLM